MDPALHDGAASKLKLKNHPPTSELVTLLEKSPPEDEATARKWFEALSSRVPGWTRLPVSIRNYFELIPLSHRFLSN